jgi:hypothetical protein
VTQNGVGEAEERQGLEDAEVEGSVVDVEVVGVALGVEVATEEGEVVGEAHSGAGEEAETEADGGDEDLEAVDVVEDGDQEVAVGGSKDHSETSMYN